MHQLAPDAIADLDRIADTLTTATGSVESAEKLMSAIAARFVMLASYPRLGRARDHDLGPGRRSHPVGDYIIIYRLVGTDISILRVLHGRQDIDSLFRT